MYPDYFTVSIATECIVTDTVDDIKSNEWL